MDYKKLIEASGVTIKEKKTSSFMRFLGAFLKTFRINDHFMNYITTIHKTIYWPDLSSVDFKQPTTYAILVHETVHADQYRRYNILFDFAYLLWPSLAPLSLLSLLAIWFSLWHLLWLVCLASLVPIPFTFRAKFEAEAHGIQYIIWKECFNYDVDSVIEYRASQTYSKSDYYFMSTKSWAKKKLHRYVDGKEKIKYKYFKLAKEIANGMVKS